MSTDTRDIIDIREPNDRDEDRPFDHVKHPFKRAYLYAIVVAAGNSRKACERLQISRSTPWVWETTDPEFAALLKIARRMAADVLESEAVRRAYEGVEEPVFYQGEQCGAVRKYSDSLMQTLLKANAPDRFKDRWEGEVTGPGGGPIQAAAMKGDPSRLSDEEFELLKGLHAKMLGAGEDHASTVVMRPLPETIDVEARDITNEENILPCPTETESPDDPSSPEPPPQSQE